MEERPGQVTAMGIMTIVSGVINISVAAGWAFIVVLGTLGLGLICLPIFLIPVILGIFEIIYGAKVLGNKAVPNTQVIGILEIVSILWGNFLTAIVAILVLVFYSDPDVKAYIESDQSV